MAFTFLALNKTTSEHKRLVTLFISEEYAAFKETDTSGNVLPNQDWQHPVPEKLHYCKVGSLVGDERVTHLVRAVLELGAGEMGGHARVMFTDRAPWIKQQTETWEDRATREREQLAERSRQEKLKEDAKAPVYEYCSRCEETTESCKNPRHRGSSLCIECGGGLADKERRHCLNCVDLPWRERREEATGREIVYLNEE